MTTNAEETERWHAIEQLRKIITENSVIHTRTEYGRGETDYVSVYVITTQAHHRTGEEHHLITNITYYVAKAARLKLNNRGIKYGGGNYNKGLEAADSCWRVVFNRALPQEQWMEIS
jgi:hypothetical protein